MKPKTGIIIIAIIFAASFYLYSTLQTRSNKPKSAVVIDSSGINVIKNTSPEKSVDTKTGQTKAISKQNPVTPQVTSTSSKVDSLNQKSIESESSNIQEGLDLLMGPIQ